MINACSCERLIMAEGSIKTNIHMADSTIAPPPQKKKPGEFS